MTHPRVFTELACCCFNCGTKTNENKLCELCSPTYKSFSDRRGNKCQGCKQAIASTYPLCYDCHSKNPNIKHLAFPFTHDDD